MKELFVGVFVACLLGSAAKFAYAQAATDSAVTEVVISTGLEGGGYWNAGERLAAAASGSGLTVESIVSSGSRLSLDRLYSEESPVSLAFVQADALQYFLNDNPAAADRFEKLETIGEECVFIISEKDGNIASDKDLQKSARLNMGIRSPKSGIWVTFYYMAHLVPELWSNTTLMYGDTVEMMTEFAHPKTNVDRTVMVVHGTNANSPEIAMVAANPDKFRFVELSDKRFTQGTADKAPVYHAMKVKSGVAEHERAVKTFCVPGLLLANTQKLTPVQHDTVTKVVLDHWDEIHLKD
ncbi:MAG: TRAP-type uncharacterized transport system substrate-binding protein [Halioglobus sp.]|jgi:TRAP-type uncharacterized transport system substrate-binding protein